MLNPEIPGDVAASKLIVLDILTVLDTGKRVNVEMQVRVDEELVSRILLYGARRFAEQLHRGENYGAVVPSVTVLWVAKRLFADQERFHSIFELGERHTGRLYSSDLEIHALQLPDLERAEVPAEHAAESAKMLHAATDEPAATDEAMTDEAMTDEVMTDVSETEVVATDVALTDVVETDVGTDVDEVSDPAILDDFASCDGAIARVAGRDGGWYTYGDLDVNLTPNTSGGAEGASTPPSGFEDSSCAAWVTGGCEVGSLDCTFGGIGLTLLTAAAPYDLAGYEGMTFGYEGDDMWVQVLDDNGGVFGVIVDGSAGARAQRTMYFDDLTPNADSLTNVPDLSAVTDIQFSALAPEAFGQAIYDLRLF